MTLRTARFMLIFMAFVIAIAGGANGIEYMEAGRYIMVVICDAGVVFWLLNAYLFYKSPWIIPFEFKESI